MENEITHLKSEFHNASIVGSPPDIGRLREIFLSHILKNMLPRSVEICSGVIFDADDNRSNQQDIVIYRRNMPRLSFGEGPQLLFAEGVIATIEVKSNIDATEFQRAMDNIKSVKSLNINIKSSGFSIGKMPSKEIKCYVFSYDSVAQESIKKYLNVYIQAVEKKFWFDYLTVLDKFTLIRNDSSVFVTKENADYILDPASKWTILSFFIHLVHNLSEFALTEIDWTKYLQLPKK